MATEHLFESDDVRVAKVFENVELSITAVPCLYRTLFSISSSDLMSARYGESEKYACFISP